MPRPAVPKIGTKHQTQPPQTTGFNQVAITGANWMRRWSPWRQFLSWRRSIVSSSPITSTLLSCKHYYQIANKDLTGFAAGAKPPDSALGSSSGNAAARPSRRKIAHRSFPGGTHHTSSKPSANPLGKQRRKQQHQAENSFGSNNIWNSFNITVLILLPFLPDG